MGAWLVGTGGVSGITRQVGNSCKFCAYNYVTDFGGVHPSVLAAPIGSDIRKKALGVTGEAVSFS